jgi:hypothetical protein
MKFSGAQNRDGLIITQMRQKLKLFMRTGNKTIFTGHVYTNNKYFAKLVKY